MEEKNTIQTTESETKEPLAQETVTPKSETTTESTKKGPINPAVILIIVGALIIAAGAYYFMSDTPAEIVSPSEGLTAAEYPDVVAIVNGEDLSSDEFIMSMTQAQQVAVQQGADINDPAVRAEIETQAMEVLVNSKLLAQAAMESGATVSDTEVETQLNELEVQYGGTETFAAALEGVGLTPESLKENIREQLMIDAYLEGNEGFSALTVTDAEVQEAYDGLSTQGSGLPPLEEIFEPLRDQLLAQKQQETVTILLDSLREAAEIENLI